MPEHVHLLLSEPERKKLSLVIQMLKQITSRKLRVPDQPRFWQARYYDFPVWSEGKRIEKLRYIHGNPVRRDLVQRPEEWKWSSFRHYATGMEGVVEIESQWTARRRERMAHPVITASPPSRTEREKDGATRLW
jgi:putative transposase